MVDEAQGDSRGHQGDDPGSEEESEGRGDPLERDRLRSVPLVDDKLAAGKLQEGLQASVTPPSSKRSESESSEDEEDESHSCRGGLRQWCRNKILQELPFIGGAFKEHPSKCAALSSICKEVVGCAVGGVVMSAVPAETGERLGARYTKLAIAMTVGSSLAVIAWNALAGITITFCRYLRSNAEGREGNEPRESEHHSYKSFKKWARENILGELPWIGGLFRKHPSKCAALSSICKEIVGCAVGGVVMAALPTEPEESLEIRVAKLASAMTVGASLGEMGWNTLGGAITISYQCCRRKMAECRLAGWHRQELMQDGQDPLVRTNISLRAQSM